MSVRFAVTVYPELDERGRPLPGFTVYNFASRADADAFYASISSEVEMVTLCRVNKGRRLFPALAQRTRGEEVFGA